MNVVKPFLKWAGGKTQMLQYILPEIPDRYNTYVEPFLGGGAVFFAVKPERAILADSNPELINTYSQIQQNIDEVIFKLKKYRNNKELFYEVRAQNWKQLSPVEAAARMIFLNKTCFNGLYRVNKQGGFNVPFGNYKKPTICDEVTLRAASMVLQGAKLICADYKEVMAKHVHEGDFVFVDPPYVPVSGYADFKRYTKEQFYEQDQRDLSDCMEAICQRGVFALLTNSNTPLVHELYAPYPMEIYQTKRYISSKSSTRTGEDVLVKICQDTYQRTIVDAEVQMALYPPTRFMGSKKKLLGDIWHVVSRFNVKTVADIFSGSGVVGYMFKAHGLQVIANDYMHMSYTFTKAMLENNAVTLPVNKAKQLLKKNGSIDTFVSDNFGGLYFHDDDNFLIDTLRTNIKNLDDEYEKAVAMAALIRACMKKRPRGLFTYTGLDKYNDGRKDLRMTLAEQFLENVEAINQAVFNNGQDNKAYCGDALSLDIGKLDLVYIDPPYYSPYSDNEYVRRYHFVEGLARDWHGVEIQENTKTKKFKSYPTPFSTRTGAASAFDELFAKYKNSIVVVSYSSNSQPTKEEMVEIMSRYKEHVEVVPIDYTYYFGNQATAKTHRNNVQEFLFVGY